MRIAVFSNTTWYLHNFRLNLMRALQAAGHEPIAIGPADGYEVKLRDAGIAHVPIVLQGASVNLRHESSALRALYRILRDERPDVLLSYTPKGNIYGALAAGALDIPVIANVSGLGRVFVGAGPFKWIVKGLYRWAFRRAAHVFFQNNEDMEYFVRLNIVQADKAERIPGSGVDVERFAPRPRTPEQPFTFLLAGRLLWEKGIGEYVQAARLIKMECPHSEFRLLGFLDVTNPSAVRRSDVDAWEAEGIVQYMGVTDDVANEYAGADCIVLPSYYREGVPRSLLEAASMAKPIITTDAIGCRDVVEEELTGYLCPPRDVVALAVAMRRMMSCAPTERAAMGVAARQKMIREFDEKIVIDNYLKRIAALADLNRPGFAADSKP